MVILKMKKKSTGAIECDGGHLMIYSGVGIEMRAQGVGCITRHKTK